MASVSSTDELMAALGSVEEAVALEAAYGLGSQVDEAGASALLNRLRDGEEMEREMAALALSAAGSAAVPALEIWGEEAEREQLRLVHALDDSETFVRFNALGALKNMRLPAGRCTELLQKVSAGGGCAAAVRSPET